MDKLGAIPSGNTFVSGVGVLLEKSKKERIRKLSAIGGSSSFEMGCDVSDREDEEQLPSKRFKLPRKFSGDCNGVHLGSVPRKLRSAMNKRHRQSTSPSLPHSRKLMSSIESLSCDGVKKPCLKQGDRSPKETVSGPITKDEEEVVETLYALAGLVFPNNEANGNSKVHSEAFDANASALTESKNSAKPEVEVGDIKLDPVFPCRAASSTSQSFVERTDQVDLLNKPAKVEQCNEKPFGDAVNFRDPSELSLDSRLKQTVEQKTSDFGRKPENSVELGTNIGSQVQKHEMLQESRKKGSGLWPGLSSNVSQARSDSPLPQSPAATLPPWMDAPCSTSKALAPNGSSFAEVTKVVNGRRSCKKYAAHAYISHLIQSLKSSENKDKLLLQPSQMRAYEGSRQGVFLGFNTFTNVKSGFNEAVSSSSISISTAENVSNEAKNGILQHKKLHLDQPSSTLASGPHTSPKQTFDFLSLSAGGGSLENNDSFSRGRYGMELLSQAQLPYLHSSVQHHNLIPFSLNRSRYNSSASLDSPSVSQQLGQLLPLYGNKFCGPQANATALTEQPIQPQQLHLQQQQQQQQLHLQHQQHQHQQQQQLHLQQQQHQHQHQQQQQLHLQQQQHQHQQQQQLHLQQQQQRLWAAQLARVQASGNFGSHSTLTELAKYKAGELVNQHLPSVYEESLDGGVGLAARLCGDLHNNN
ncbi:hypothetical protein ACLB2K_015174 [Fragaria x ananassa]